MFLGDITAAYQKNPELESLLFDDFFLKGAYEPNARRSQLTINQLSTRPSPDGGACALRLPYGVYLFPRSRRRCPSSTATGVQCFQPTCCKLNATTLVHTRSASFLERRMSVSSPTRISVRPLLHFYDAWLIFGLDINWTGRGGNVSASTYIV